MVEQSEERCLSISIPSASPMRKPPAPPRIENHALSRLTPLRKPRHDFGGERRCVLLRSFHDGHVDEHVVPLAGLDVIAVVIHHRCNDHLGHLHIILDGLRGQFLFQSLLRLGRSTSMVGVITPMCGSSMRRRCPASKHCAVLGQCPNPGIRSVPFPYATRVVD